MGRAARHGMTAGCVRTVLTSTRDAGRGEPRHGTLARALRGAAPWRRGSNVGRAPAWLSPLPPPPTQHLAPKPERRALPRACPGPVHSSPCPTTNPRCLSALLSPEPTPPYPDARSLPAPSSQQLPVLTRDPTASWRAAWRARWPPCAAPNPQTGRCGPARCLGAESRAGARMAGTRFKM